jgi:putative pyoverdin transport system ATP-binding/permease protein
VLQLIRFLMFDAPIAFWLATLASTFSGVMRMGVLILLFRILGNGADVDTQVWEFLAIAATAVVSRHVAESLLGRLARMSFTQFRLRFADQVATAPLIDLEALGSSRLVTCMTQDIVQVAAAAPSLVQMFANIAFATVCLAYLGWLSPQRLCLILVIISGGILLYHAWHRKGIHYMRLSRGKLEDLAHAFRTLIEGAKELRLNTWRQSQVRTMFEGHATELQRSNASQATYFERAAIGTDVLFFLALGLGIFGISRGATDPHILVSYSVSIIYLIGPLRGIVGIGGNLRGAGVALERVHELGFQLNRERSVAPQDGRVCDSCAGCWSELELQGVIHEYPANGQRDAVFQVGPINLKLYPGQIVFIVGDNGSGKTTLAKLITGLYAPAAGDLRLNGQLVTECNRDHYRRHFSAVFNDPFVFDRLVGSVAEGCMARAVEFITRLGLEKKLNVAQDMLSNTAALSMGERKRVALLHAYLEDRAIYVFDEWAAEQDPMFKDVFYRDILCELRARGKLVIVVSHDSRYFDIADQTISLDAGVLQTFPRHATAEIEIG